MKKRPQPDAQMLFNVMNAVRDYDASAVARALITMAAGLIATGPNPDRELAAMQQALADQMRKCIDSLPGALEHLDRARAELASVQHANKGSRREQ